MAYRILVLDLQKAADRAGGQIFEQLIEGNQEMLAGMVVKLNEYILWVSQADEHQVSPDGACSKCGALK